MSSNANNWIEQLPDEARQAVSDCMQRRQLAKGSVIYHEGRLHRALWQVVSGTVKITNQTADGKEVIFALFNPGDCFGELSLIDGIAAANTATAVEAVELAELSKADFDALMAQYPVLARQMTLFLSSRMRHLLSFYSDVTLCPLEQRIARRICYLDSGATGLDASVALQFSQQNLAAMVGATRQAVSKVLNDWRSQGIISLEYGRISIIGGEQLQRIADGVSS